MDKNIKNKLEQFQSYLKLAKKKKLFIYKFNNLTLENGFELDYFSTKKKNNHKHWYCLRKFSAPKVPRRNF